MSKRHSSMHVSDHPARKGTFALSVLRGAATATEIYARHEYVYPHSSTRSALRGDWECVGSTISSSMGRIREEATKAQGKKRPV